VVGDRLSGTAVALGAAQAGAVPRLSGEPRWDSAALAGKGRAASNFKEQTRKGYRMLPRHRRTSILPLATVLSLVSVLAIIPSQAAAAGSRFAAIAYSDQTGRYGYAYGYNDRQNAQDDALARCDAPDGRVVVWVEHGWVALALGERGVAGWAWSTRSRADAETRALRQCGCNGSIVAWACSG
jgi:hypothetical protein